MTSAREVFLTLEDDAAFSAALREEFPNVMFLDGWYWDASLGQAQDRDSLADCGEDFARIILYPDGWKPQFDRSDDDVYFVDCPPTLLIERSWAPGVTMAQSWEKDGRPAEIRKGSIQVVSNGHEAGLEFTRRVWRALDRVASNDLIHIAAPSGGVVYEGGGAPHPYYAGHHAILWAAAAPQRVFEYVPRADLAPDRGWGCYPHARAVAAARAAVDKIPVSISKSDRDAWNWRNRKRKNVGDPCSRLAHVRGEQSHNVTGEPLIAERAVGPQPGAIHAAEADNTYRDRVTGDRRRIMIAPMRKGGETPVARYRRKIARLKDNLGDAGMVHVMRRRRPGESANAYARIVAEHWAEIHMMMLMPGLKEARERNRRG